jgi:hypothetical protein
MFPANGDGSHPHVPGLPSARPPRRTDYPSLGLFAECEPRWSEGEADDDVTEDWPAWTDIPVHWLDYDAFDDDGECTEVQEEEDF